MKPALGTLPFGKIIGVPFLPYLGPSEDPQQDHPRQERKNQNPYPQNVTHLSTFS